MGIMCLWEEDGFHLARLGTNRQQGLHNFFIYSFAIHNFAHFCTQFCTICFAILQLSNPWGQPLLFPKYFCFLQCHSRNYNCKFHQVIFLHISFRGFSTWMTLASCWEMCNFYTRLHMEQKYCHGMRRFSFYLGIDFKESFLKPGFDWRLLEEVTDLHTASLCWHFTPKIIVFCVSNASTTSELQGASFC